MTTGGGPRAALQRRRALDRTSAVVRWPARVAPLLGDGPIVPLRLNESYTLPTPIIVVRIVATWRSSSPVPA